MGPITTGGFQVQAQPGINYLPAGQLVGNLGNIVPSVSQGAALVSQLAQINNEARTAPIRQALQQIQLQDAQNRLAAYPTQQALQQIALSEAQKRNAVPLKDLGDITLQGGDQTEYPSALDENGDRSGPSDFVTNPLVKIQEETKYGPGGAVTQGRQSTTLKTAEQIDAERAKEAAAIRASDALAQRRATPKAFEYDNLVQKRDEAVADGDSEAAALYDARLKKLSSVAGFLPTGTTYNRRLETMVADAGLTQSQGAELAKTPDGIDAISKMAAARKLAARGSIPVTNDLSLTALQKQLIQSSANPVPAPSAPAAPMFTVPGLGGSPAAPAAIRPASIPQSAIDYLIQNPSLAGDFDAMYGTGAAESVLPSSGGQ